MQCADKVMYRAKNAGRNRSFKYADHQADIAAVG
jgi:PleD family two-component response regulator